MLYTAYIINCTLCTGDAAHSADAVQQMLYTVTCTVWCLLYDWLPGLPPPSSLPRLPPPSQSLQLWGEVAQPHHQLIHTYFISKGPQKILGFETL